LSEAVEIGVDSCKVRRRGRQRDVMVWPDQNEGVVVCVKGRPRMLVLVQPVGASDEEMAFPEVRACCGEFSKMALGFRSESEQGEPTTGQEVEQAARSLIGAPTQRNVRCTVTCLRRSLPYPSCDPRKGRSTGN
jgi:hypothetical protein